MWQRRQFGAVPSAGRRMLQCCKETSMDRPCLSLLGTCQLVQTHLVQKSIKNRFS